MTEFYDQSTHPAGRETKQAFKASSNIFFWRFFRDFQSTNKAFPHPPKMTRFGEFSPFGRLLTLGSVNYRSSPHFDQKWTFVLIFSRTHRVTLLPLHLTMAR
jgi:hypothetical protein